MLDEERTKRSVVDFCGLGAGMKIQLAHAIGKISQEVRQGRRVHASRRAQAEDAVGKFDAV